MQYTLQIYLCQIHKHYIQKKVYTLYKKVIETFYKFK